MSHPDLFFAVPPAPQPSKRRRADRRRALTVAEPLEANREPIAFVQAMLHEYAAALSCERRSRCEAKKLTTSGDERRTLVLDGMDDALRRMANVELALVKRLTGQCA